MRKKIIAISLLLIAVLFISCISPAFCNFQKTISSSITLHSYTPQSETTNSEMMEIATLLSSYIKNKTHNFPTFLTSYNITAQNFFAAPTSWYAYIIKLIIDYVSSLDGYHSAGIITPSDSVFGRDYSQFLLQDYAEAANYSWKIQYTNKTFVITVTSIENPSYYYECDYTKPAEGKAYGNITDLPSNIINLKENL